MRFTFYNGVMRFIVLSTIHRNFLLSIINIFRTHSRVHIFHTCISNWLAVNTEVQGRSGLIYVFQIHVECTLIFRNKHQNLDASRGKLLYKFS